MIECDTYWSGEPLVLLYSRAGARYLWRSKWWKQRVKGFWSLKRNQMAEWAQMKPSESFMAAVNAFRLTCWHLRGVKTSLAICSSASAQVPTDHPIISPRNVTGHILIACANMSCRRTSKNKVLCGLRTAACVTLWLPVRTHCWSDTQYRSNAWRDETSHIRSTQVHYKRSQPAAPQTHNPAGAGSPHTAWHFCQFAHTHTYKLSWHEMNSHIWKWWL